MKTIHIIKSIVFLSLFIIITTGCSNEKNLGQNPPNTNTNQFQPTRDTPEQNEELEHTLGFVRYTNENVKMMRETELEAPKINRKEMADMITKIILQNDTFKEAATLVTDSEVLIAFEAQDHVDLSKTITYAKKTAESIMPAFYKIYVSHQPQHMDLINSLHNSGVNSNTKQTINKIIQEMNKTHGEQEDEI